MTPNIRRQSCYQSFPADDMPTPETPDIDLEAVANLIRALEKAGLIEIVKR